MSGSKIFSLLGKTSVVTGAGNGLGRTFCEALAENGSDIVCVDIDKKAADEAARMSSKYGVKAISLGGDVSKKDDVEYLFNTIKDEYGKLDVLFNNAGITTISTPLHEMPLEYWNNVINTNLTGAFFCMQEAIKIMLQEKSGSIINISSISGLYGVPTKSNYCASKAGVIGLTKSAAVEYGPYNIRVNAIAPGMFQGTKLGQSAGMSDKDIEELCIGYANETPLGRVADLQEIKGLALFLASEAASFVTGGVFVIDGGYIVNHNIFKED